MRYNEIFRAKRLEKDLSQQALADAAGVERGQITIIEGGKRLLTNRYWEKAIAVLGISREEFLGGMTQEERDSATGSVGRSRPKSFAAAATALPNTLLRHVHNTDSPSGPRLIPVMGQPAAGAIGRLAMGEPVEYDACPPWLERASGVYFLDVPSNSMAPRFLPGERIAVHPGKPYTEGDYVVVQYDVDGEIVGIVKQFLRWEDDGDLILAQYNPAEEIRIPGDDVRDVHKVFIHGLG